MSGTHQSVLIAEEQTAPAGEVLAQAFFNDPLCVYTQSDLEKRMSEFTWLFTQLVREGVPQDGVYTDSRVGRPDGVAIWVPPQTNESAAEEAVWSEMNQMEQHFEPGSHRRFTEAYSYYEQIHHKWAPGLHWYLALLGVSPCRQKQGIGSALLTPIFQRADQECLPCYLETFVAANVPFYEHLGFQLVEAGADPGSQVAFWAMRREPRTAQ